MRKTLEKALNKYLADASAVDFCLKLWDVIQVWDDLIDSDPVSNEDVNKAFITLMIDLPRNQFYRAFEVDLRPLMMSAILQWQVANEFENSPGGEDLNKAYMLRAGYYNIVHYCVYLIHGTDIAEKLGPDILRIYGEKLNEFKGANHA